MTAPSARTSRIEARLAPAALASIRRAAEIQGRSLSDFVVAAAQDAAERTLFETQIIRLSMADQEAVAELLENPPPTAEGMVKAFESHRRLIKQTA